MVEQTNRELEQQIKAAEVFPNEEPLIRLVGAILTDTNGEWVTGRRSLTAEKE